VTWIFWLLVALVVALLVICVWLLGGVTIWRRERH